MAASRIKGITIKIGGDTTQLQKSLQGVDKVLKTTQNNLKDVNRLLKLDPKNAELLTQKQKNLAGAIDTTKQRLKELRSVSKDSVKPEEWDAVQREIAETEQDLKKLEKEYKNFGSVGAQQVAAVGKQVEAVGHKMAEVGQTMTTYVTLPLVALGTAGAKSFAEVDKTMQLTNATMGNTAEQAELLNNAMKDAAANSTFGMNDAATATLNFARAGLTAEEAAAALAPAMNLAAGEGGNLDTVSGGLVATINGFGDTFDNAAYYADVFANACNNSALNVDELSSAMSTAAHIFAAAGYSVNDAALYMGVMANAGIPAAEAANSLKTGLARLIKPSKEGAEWMEKLGVSVTNSDGSMKNSLTVQRELNKAFGKLSESEQIAAASAIFGKSQMSNWLALINTAPSDVRALTTALQTEGTTAQMAEQMMSGFGGSLEKLKSSLDVAMTSLGEALAPVILAVAEKIQGLVDWFNSLDASQQQMIATIGLVVAAIGPILLILGNLIVLVGQVMTFAPLIIGAIGPVVAAIGSVVTAIGIIPIAIAAAAILIATHWEEIKAATAEFIAAAKAEFEKFKNNIKQVWNNIVTAVQNAVAKVKQKVEDMKTAIGEKITAIKNFFISLQTTIGEKIEAIKTKFGELKTNIITTATNLLSSVKEKFEAVKKAITDPVDTAKELVGKAIDAIKGLFSGATFEFPHINLPHFSWTWESIGGLVSIPKIHIDWYKKAYDNPYLFNSPTVMGTNAGLKGFGDGNGGEIVYGRDQLMRDIAQAAGGETNYTVNVYAADGMDINVLAAKVQNKFVQWERQKEAAFA